MHVTSMNDLGYFCDIHDVVYIIFTLLRGLSLLLQNAV